MKKINRKTFHILTEEDDLYKIFENDENKSSLNQNFENVIEESLSHKDQRVALQKKKNIDTLDKSISGQQQMKKLLQPQKQLDLHGFSSIEAEKKTESFILTSIEAGFHCLRIITGKGLHSPDGAVLKGVIEVKLKSMQQNGLIKRSQWERSTMDKSGAIIVYLA